MFSQKNLHFNERTLLAVGVPASRSAKDRLRGRFCLFLAFCLLLLSLSVAQAQVTEEWVARYNGPGNGDDNAGHIAVDASGNVYVTGTSPGSGTGNDYLTIKYDPNGNQLWEARYNGPANSNDTASALAVDASGNVYVTGQSNGSGTANDYATIKYDSNGNQLWVARYNGPGNEYDFGQALAIDASGNVYVTGFSDNIWHAYDYATIKYDTNGNQLWVARYTNQATDYAYAIAVDSSGNVYVTGGSQASGTGYDYTTIKYDTNGSQLWVRRYNGSVNGGDFGQDVAVDSSGNVYVTGYSPGSGTGLDYATIKYDTNGIELWVRRYNGSVNGDESAHALAIDSSGNVYVTGESVGSGTAKDYATIKYATNGNQIWVKRYNGPGNGDDSANDIALDDSTNVYVTGGSTGSGTGKDYATIEYSQQLSINISADAGGNPKDNFLPQEHVYGKTTGLSLTDDTYPLYVVATTTWTGEENQTIPARIDPPGTENDPETTIEVHNGNIQKDAGGTPEDIWVNPPANETAQYDIVVDINKDGDYDPSVDLLDADSEIGAGFSLPVELSSFTATTGDSKVTLRWRTETEVNNIGFAIYRSEAKDGNYTKIDFVSGAGSTAMSTDYQFADTKIEPGKTYFYYLEDVDVTGVRNKNMTIKVFVPAKIAEVIPKEFRLLQNYPNPFNPETWIPYDLASDAVVVIRIYNVNGQLVRQLDLGKQKAGSYVDKKKAAYWDGKGQSGNSVANGLYFYTLKAGDFQATRRMVIVK